jgi:hypothetical protein
MESKPNTTSFLLTTDETLDDVTVNSLPPIPVLFKSNGYQLTTLHIIHCPLNVKYINSDLDPESAEKDRALDTHMWCVIPHPYELGKYVKIVIWAQHFDVPFETDLVPFKMGQDILPGIQLFRVAAFVATTPYHHLTCEVIENLAELMIPNFVGKESKDPYKLLGWKRPYALEDIKSCLEDTMMNIMVHTTQEHHPECLNYIYDLVFPAITAQHYMNLWAPSDPAKMKLVTMLLNNNMKNHAPILVFFPLDNEDKDEPTFAAAVVNVNNKVFSSVLTAADLIVGTTGVMRLQEYTFVKFEDSDNEVYFVTKEEDPAIKYTSA